MECNGGNDCYLQINGECHYKDGGKCRLRVDIYGNFHHADQLKGFEEF